MTLGYLVKQAARKRGEPYLSFPQRLLFDKIGIRRQLLEPDPYGNFLLTGYDYGTGRNWARLGLLYLQDGVWEGERLLPEGFAELVSTPAPAWDLVDIRPYQNAWSRHGYFSINIINGFTFFT